MDKVKKKRSRSKKSLNTEINTEIKKEESSSQFNTPKKDMIKIACIDINTPEGIAKYEEIMNNENHYIISDRTHETRDGLFVVIRYMIVSKGISSVVNTLFTVEDKVKTEKFNPKNPIEMG